MKTKAAVLTKLKAPLEIWDLDLPLLKEGQVLVKMAYSGLCHSQLNEIAGLKGEDKFLPHTLGHEGSGTVEAVGNGVTKVSPGDKVVVSWLKGRGADILGTQYGSKQGTVNSGAVSTFLTHAVLSENRVISIPQTMPLKEAALLGCAIPTGAGVVKNEMQVKEGQSFAIFGAGGVGLSALLAAKYAKAYPIIAIDVVEEKLQKARHLGATHAIHARQCDPLQEIQIITQGKGIDYVFESAGKREAMEKAFGALKAPGGLCVLAGNLPQGEKISIDPFDLIRGKRIIGTWGGGSKIDHDVTFYADLYLKGVFALTPLITHEVSLEQINDLISKLSAGHVGRGLIKF
jgi:S-(hydroxymethyl)glutathione dehydrogenase/alcohol dehydrogenase